MEARVSHQNMAACLLRTDEHDTAQVTTQVTTLNTLFLLAIFGAS